MAGQPQHQGKEHIDERGGAKFESCSEANAM